MQRSVFFLTLFLSFYFSVSAQVDSFQEDIIQCLQINGTYQESEKEYNKMYTLLGPQWETANVPEEVWADLKKNKEQKIQELIASRAYAYRAHFTNEEILAMRSFYESEAGAQLVADPMGLTAEQQGEVATFFASALGQKIESKKEPLAANILEITREWNKELWSETISQLVKRGYSPKQ